MSACLSERLVRRILHDGPLTVADYVTACLHDPAGGYYATRPALGADGDFITAPLVSQMFGELIGAWLAEMWLQMGSPTPVRLVELGPGDGTLMQDASRVLARVEGFLAAAELWLVEPSAPLRARQAERLAGLSPRFARTLDEVAAGAPILLVANEVFDCLPARQFLRVAEGWAERRVGLDADARMVVGLGPLPAGTIPPEAPVGAIWEQSPPQAALAGAIGSRVAADGGAALVIDYGRATPGFGDTLQALSRHRKVDWLAAPGEADLTQHVDFPALATAAQARGAVTSPIVTQGEFLRALGIETRAVALARHRPDMAGVVGRQLERLIAPDQMGELFKAMSIHTEGLDPPGLRAQEAAA